MTRLKNCETVTNVPSRKVDASMFTTYSVTVIYQKKINELHFKRTWMVY